MSTEDKQDEREEQDGAVRGRPGRRTLEERTEAVLALLAGKASVDQLATRYGVRADTIEKWREDALGGVTAALRRGSRSPREAELERENQVLRDALTRQTMKAELLERALESRGGPSSPTRSRR